MLTLCPPDAADRLHLCPPLLSLGAIQDIVGVSILRSGGPFSQGLRRVIRDVPIGALLIQSHPRTGEPLLLSCKLPHQLRSPKTSTTTQVFLLDSQMGTGAAAREFFRPANGGSTGGG